MRKTSKVFSIIAVLLILCYTKISIAENYPAYDDDLNNSDSQENDRDTDDIERKSEEDGTELRRLLSKELTNSVTHAELKAPDVNNRHKGREQQRNPLGARTDSFSHTYNDDDDVDDDDSEERSDDTSYNPWRDSFNDQFEDGSYAFGYSLPYGVRRYERSYYSEKYKGRVVEGFHTEARHWGTRLVYELRCYRADAYGYRPLKVQYLRRPPIVRRHRVPNVTCFDEDTRN